MSSVSFTQPIRLIHDNKVIPSKTMKKERRTNLSHKAKSHGLVTFYVMRTENLVVEKNCDTSH